MTEKRIEVDIYYTEHPPVISYAETFLMPKADFQGLMYALQDDTLLTFTIEEKVFNKLEIASIGFGDLVFQIGHTKQEK